MASVARACTDELPSPLEGLSPGPVAESIRAALTTGLVDDLDWLAGASAAAALYEIAAILPPGNEKRELGRRVLSRLTDGDASTFVALATRMALGSGKGLSGDGVSARVRLAMALPSSAGVRVDPLALALVSRRELARTWVGENATGSLPDRRLAARVVEHAARAIVRRASQGDDAPMRALRGDAASVAQARLFADREPLVWRHIAVARGLVAAYHPPFLEGIEGGFSPELSPTEWRRAATSLVASAATRPELALKRVREVLQKGALRRDPGAASAFLWGLPAAAEVEPEAAEEILDLVLAHAPALPVAEALPDVLAEGPGGNFGARAREMVAGVLGRAVSTGSTDDVDDGALALRAQLLGELGPDDGRKRCVVDVLRAGLHAFVREGARAAFACGQEALELARASFATLEALEDHTDPGRAGSISRRTGFTALRDLDLGLFEDGVAADLLALGAKGEGSEKAQRDLAALTSEVAEWVLARESTPMATGTRVAHATLRQRRIRTLLHVADSGTGGDEAPVEGLHLRVAATMVRVVAAGPPPAIHRILVATLARAVDALLRDEACDPADVLLVAAYRRLAPEDLDTLGEASMNVDLRALLSTYADLVRSLMDSGGAESQAPLSILPLDASSMQVTWSASGSFDLVAAGAPLSSPSMIPPVSLASPVGRRLAALGNLARAIGADASTRAEATRTAVNRVSRALARLHTARSRSELLGPSSPFPDLEAGVVALGQLTAGARQRLGDRDSLTDASSRVTGLASTLDAALRGPPNELVTTLNQVRADLGAVLPGAFGEILASVLDGVNQLPTTASLHEIDASEPETPLPAWLPPRRTIGGFHVMRALGAGTGGTVFKVRRIEDRHDPKAETFALKVPDYDGNAARTLSEEEFLQLFREEASALLGLPHHPNLARFVTFDLSARPKPILVMELVEGPSLDRILRTRQIDMPTVFECLDGVGSGLEAMHRAGLGHLDVKPSNVILRDGAEAVLVDFGLAGRHLRPGCATLPYGAPEVWGVVPDGHTPLAPAADVYAFGCLVFELLWGVELFDGPSEMAIVTAHVSHDGWPLKLAAMRERDEVRPIAELIARCLRHDPRERATIEQVRAGLRDLARKYSGASWPIGAGLRRPAERDLVSLRVRRRADVDVPLREQRRAPHRDVRRLRLAEQPREALLLRRARRHPDVLPRRDRRRIR